MKILHIITSLNIGGAEMALYRLLAQMDSGKFESKVISLVPGGPMKERIISLPVCVSDLGMKRGLPSLKGMYKLFKIIKQWKPDIIQTWLYHADLLGLFMGMLFPKCKVIWNLRCSYLDFNDIPLLTAFTIKLCAKLSFLPNAIIANSHAGLKYHKDLGYKKNQYKIIPNGFDLNIFKPDEKNGLMIRKEFNIPKKSFCIGFIARFDIIKDHENFLKAINIIQKNKQDIHVIMCGEDIDSGNKKLKAWIDQNNLKNVHLIGKRDDVHNVMNSLDIIVLSSKGEGFPNVIGEAMACGIPCVATNVGDSASIINNTGFIVPPADHKLLAKAIIKMINMPESKRNELGKKAAKRIALNFSLDAVSKQYESFYIFNHQSKELPKKPQSFVDYQAHEFFC